MKRNVLSILSVLVLVSFMLLSCGGGGGGGNGTSSCATPLTLTAGTWCITIQSTQNTCSTPLNSTPYTATFTQNGTILNAVSQFSHTYAGSICGNDAVMTGNNFGISTTMNITFSNADNAVGSVDWNTGTCGGTDTFIAVAGNCGTSSVDTTAPSTPTGLMVSAVSSTQISLSWTASTDNVAVTGYKIYKAGTFLKSVTTTTASDTVVNVSEACYTVSAVDAANNESAKTAQQCAPAPPSNTGKTWVIDTIEAFTSDADSDIAVDANNKAHVSFYHYETHSLKYATNMVGSWVTSTVDNAGVVGMNSSIAVDSGNKAHISYRDFDNNDLKYATNALGSWQTTSIDSAGSVGEYTSIAVDANDKVHISYYDYTNSALKYATNALGSWATATVDNSGYVGWYTSIAVDSNNKAYISYFDSTNQSLKLATNVTGTWVSEQVDSGNGQVGHFSSLALDANNKAHISYYDITLKDLKYATNASGAWVLATVSSGGDVGRYSSIAVDSQNKVHISCAGPDNYATNASGSWMTTPVGWSVYTSIAVDTNNVPHISYFDSNTFSLKYAVYE